MWCSAVVLNMFIILTFGTTSNASTVREFFHLASELGLPPNVRITHKNRNIPEQTCCTGYTEHPQHKYRHYHGLHRNEVTIGRLPETAELTITRKGDVGSGLTAEVTDFGLLNFTCFFPIQSVEIITQVEKMLLQYYSFLMIL